MHHRSIRQWAAATIFDRVTVTVTRCISRVCTDEPFAIFLRVFVFVSRRCRSSVPLHRPLGHRSFAPPRRLPIASFRATPAVRHRRNSAHPDSAVFAAVMSRSSFYMVVRETGNFPVAQLSANSFCNIVVTPAGESFSSNQGAKKRCNVIGRYLIFYA